MAPELKRNPEKMNPRLPSDLERDVFECAALSRPVMIPRLMLVAWRVKEWTEPLLYRIVFLAHVPPTEGLPRFTADILLAAIERKGADFIRTAVRHLFLGEYRWPQSTSTSALRTILAGCTGVKQLLAIDRMAPYRTFLAAMPLRMLTLDVGHLFDVSIRFEDPIFHAVTHLELLDTVRSAPPDAEEWAGLALLPCLTHLAFNDIELAPAIVAAVPKCAGLQCIVLLRPHRETFDRNTMERTATLLTSDERFVYIGQSNFHRDWLKQAQMRPSYWDIAEAVTRAKREGRRGRSEYYLLDTSHFF